MITSYTVCGPHGITDGGNQTVGNVLITLCEYYLVGTDGMKISYTYRIETRSRNFFSFLNRLFKFLKVYEFVYKPITFRFTVLCKFPSLGSASKDIHWKIYIKRFKNVTKKLKMYISKLRNISNISSIVLVSKLMIVGRSIEVDFRNTTKLISEI